MWPNLVVGVVVVVVAATVILWAEMYKWVLIQADVF
jgi:hypothetical protein